MTDQNRFSEDNVIVEGWLQYREGVLDKRDPPLSKAELGEAWRAFSVAYMMGSAKTLEGTNASVVENDNEKGVLILLAIAKAGFEVHLGPMIEAPEREKPPCTH